MSAGADIRRTAAEYVLGTLDAAERAAWRARMSGEPEVAALVRLWEERLAPLHELSAPASPPDELFADILAALPPLQEIADEVVPPVDETHVPTEERPSDTADVPAVAQEGDPLSDAPDDAPEGGGAAAPVSDVPPVDMIVQEVPPDAPPAVPPTEAEGRSDSPPPPSMAEDAASPAPPVEPEAEASAQDVPSEPVPVSLAPVSPADIVPEAAGMPATELSSEDRADVPEREEPAAAGPVAERVAAPLEDAPSSDPPTLDAPPPPEDASPPAIEPLDVERPDAEPAAPVRWAEGVAPAVEFAPHAAGPGGSELPAVPDVRPPLSARPVETGDTPPNAWRRLSGVLMLALLLGAGGFAYRELHRPDPGVPADTRREAALETAPVAPSAAAPEASEPKVAPEAAAQVPVSPPPPPPPPPEPVPEAFAVLGPQPVPAVGLAFDPDTGLVSVLKVSVPPRAGMRYDLWIVTAQAGTRHLAGFREPGAYVSDLLPALTPAQLADALLIVTEEPDGSTPADAPTGTPLYSGMAVRR
ncbi:MAG: hypothetical protein B7Y70_10165 [Rhizobiales bacterium 35-68-8]|nr:MAG: hypothetical protein B7Y70_10165 [Rhizobiales bacterium 35-68-8]